MDATGLLAYKAWLEKELQLPFPLQGFVVNIPFCRKFGARSEIVPRNSEEEVAAFKWLPWTARDLEPCVSNIYKYEEEAPFFGSEANSKARYKSYDDLRALLQMLEEELQANTWLVGSRFTIADLQISSLLDGMAATEPSARATVDGFPRTRSWVSQCLTRQKARESAPFDEHIEATRDVSASIGHIGREPPLTSYGNVGLMPVAVQSKL